MPKRASKPKSTVPRTRTPPAQQVLRTTLRPSAILHDHVNHKLFIFTEDMLVNQLRREGPKIESSFDRLCSEDLAEISRLLSKSSSLLFSGSRIAATRDDSLQLSCAKLLLNASHSFGAATALLRMGYLLQPGIIIRSMLESISTVLHLIQRPDDLKKFQSVNLPSPSTIALAKKAIPNFGQLYGYFSESFAHIGHLHHSLDKHGEYSERHNGLETNLSFLRLTSWLLYVTTELLFNDLLDEPRYWKVEPNGYRYDPSDTEREWMHKYLHGSDDA